MAGSDVIAVRSAEALRRMEVHLLSRQRHAPAVALSPDLDGCLAPSAHARVREIVGEGPRIYLVGEEQLMRRLRLVLGRALTLPPCALRIWWPGLTLRSDPADHPFVLGLDGESEEGLLTEFERQFEFSRPRTREMLREIEDSRSLAQYERDRALERARRAEERLTARSRSGEVTIELPDSGTPPHPGGGVASSATMRKRRS